MKATPFKLDGYAARQLLELDACTRCGECLAWCPAYNENRREDANPQAKIERLRSWVRRQYGLRARLFGPQPIAPGELAAFSRGVYDCTLCGRCREVCPVGLETRGLWLAMREHLVELGLLPPALAHLRKTVTATRNLAGHDNAGRLAWSENLPEPIPTGGRAELVYFAGCVAALYPQAYAVPQSFAQSLQRAGVAYSTLGGEEWCCGFPLIAAGATAEAKAMAQHNVAAVRTMGARTLVTTCPSCYHTWRHEYPRLTGEALGFEVRHATELMLDLVEASELRPGRYPRRLTYHDPCDLGRLSGIYEAPRRLLRALPGVELLEMRDSRQLALCCGGGGDLEAADPELAGAMAARRLAQAEETGAEAIVTACQQCKRTLTTAARRKRARLRVLDITEAVWQAASLQE